MVTILWGEIQINLDVKKFPFSDPLLLHEKSSKNTNCNPTVCVFRQARELYRAQNAQPLEFTFFVLFAILNILLRYPAFQ